jgi:hypothetical protein
MATIDHAQINELMAQASNLELGPTQTGLLEEAVRMADLLADIPLGLEARTKFIRAANRSGAPEKALVAISWCLAQLDRDPERFSEREILWEYPGVINHLMSFPQLSREQILAALADLSRRFERAGYGMREIYSLQFIVAGEMGDLDEHHAAHARWLKLLRGDRGNWSADDLDTEVTYLADCGRDEDAIATARPILDGTVRGTFTPHDTLARVLLPLVRLGRLDEAVACHAKGYRLIARNRHFLFKIAQHIEFLAVTDNLARGVKLFEAHLPWSLDTFDLIDRFRFSLASWVLFDRVRASGKKTIKLRLPSNFPIFEASGKYAIPGMVAWLEADAAGLARRFDDRNGNNAYALKIEAARALEALVTPFPLKARAGRGVGPPP